MPNAVDIAAITGLITALTALIAAISGVLNHRKITKAQKTADQVKTITTDSAAQVADVHESLSDPAVVKLINGHNGGADHATNGNS